MLLSFLIFVHCTLRCIATYCKSPNGLAIFLRTKFQFCSMSLLLCKMGGWRLHPLFGHGSGKKTRPRWTAYSVRGNLMATPNFKGVGRHNPAMCLEGESDCWVDSTDDETEPLLAHFDNQKLFKSHCKRTVVSLAVGLCHQGQGFCSLCQGNDPLFFCQHGFLITNW